MYITREIERALFSRMSQRKVVLVTGARQVGKTTLLRECLPDGYSYVTLDDYSARSLAARDPMSFFTVYGYPSLCLNSSGRSSTLSTRRKSEAWSSSRVRRPTS